MFAHSRARQNTALNRVSGSLQDQIAESIELPLPAALDDRGGIILLEDCRPHQDTLGQQKRSIIYWTFGLTSRAAQQRYLLDGVVRVLAVALNLLNARPLDQS